MTEPSSRRLRAVLAVGFVLFLGGLVAAMRDPATTYELSIYGATTAAFWVATAVAFLVGVAVAFGASGSPWVRRGGSLLLYLCALTVVGLPLVREYYFLGAGDALSHLGWIKEVGSGALEPTGLLYPGGHTIAVALHDVGGLTYRAAELLTLVAFVAVYLLSFPLLVQAVADRWDRRGGFAFLVGLLTALLWLPLNGISVHKSFHPFSFGVLFLPFVLYLVLAYVRQPTERLGYLKRPTVVGGLLAFASVVTTMVHPQAALVLVLILGAVSGVQFLVRRTGWAHPIAKHRTLYGQTVFAAALLVTWLAQFRAPVRVFSSTLASLYTGGAPAAEVTQRSSSLTEIGGGIVELYGKLFVPGTVFILIAGVYLLVRWTGTGDRLADRDHTFVDYLAVGLVPLAVIFAVAFVANVTTQHFRYHGAAMLLVAVIGAVALTTLGPGRASATWPSRATVAAVVLVVLLVPVAAMSLYASPYIYQPTSHVTEAQVDGYETMLDHRTEDATITGVRQKYFRYLDAIEGREGTRRTGYEAPAGVPESVFNTNLSTYYDDPHYLTVTRLDYQREVVLYGGFRYSESGFRSLDVTPGIDRVQSNGDFRQYHLAGNATEAS